MADRSYIIEVLLQAKDNMSRAFAEATGQMEAYNRLLDEQRAKTEAQTRAQQGYAREFERGDNALKQHKRAMSDLNLETTKSVNDLIALEKAQRKVTQAQSEGKGGTSEYAKLTAELDKATHQYAESLALLEDRSKNAAKAEAEAARQRVAASERVRIAVLRQTQDEQAAAKAAEQRYKDELANQKALASAAAAIDKERERSRSESMRRLAQLDNQEAQERNQRQRQEAADEIANRKALDSAAAAIDKERERARSDSMRRLAELDKQEAQDRKERQRQDTAFERARNQAASAQERVIASVTARVEGPARTLARTDVSQAAELDATRRLTAARMQLIQAGLSEVEADHAIHNIRQDALQDLGFANQAERNAVQVERAHADALREVGSATKEYERLVKNVAQAERDLEIAQSQTMTGRGKAARPLSQDERQQVVSVATVDLTRAREEMDRFRLEERARKIDATLHVDTRRADIDVAAYKRRLEAENLASGASSGGGGGGIIGTIMNIKNAMANLDTSTGGFNTHFKSAFGFAAVALIQPLMALIIGLVGAMGALASAAVAAGGALGGLFISAGAQGVPAFGLLAAAMQRLGTIVSYVSTAHQQLQQRFLAQYQAAAQNKIGINQIAIAQNAYRQALLGVAQAQFGVTSAQHSYRDALFQQQQALRNVGIAQFQLTQTRQQATRQLQDLILQEKSAKLAAEGSTLAVADAQRALRAAIATGGDVQAAQLQLQQAQVQHVQSTVGAQRAITDAAQGSVARQAIGETVSQAQNAVEQAKRASSDAQFAVQSASVAVANAQNAVAQAEFGAQQARAAIALAQQQAAGYSIATAAQLAYLRSQMTATEKALAGNIQRIYDMFAGVSGRMRPLTDAILHPFIGITDRILQLTRDPRLMGAFQGLANSMGGAFKTVGKELLDPEAVTGFIKLLRAAATNMAPLAKIASSFFTGIGAIAQAAIPYVHQFLGFISQAADRFSRWAASAGGQNWLKRFFDVGFRSLEAFMRLGGAFVKLILAIVTTGGGAKTGIGLLQGLIGWINRTTDSINNHGKAWHTLQQFWSAAKPALSALGTILGALGHAFMVLGTTSQGQRAMKDLADIIAHVLVPGIQQAFQWLGKMAGAVLNFVHHHPALMAIAKDIVAFGVAGSIAAKGIGLIFGPMAALIGMVGQLISAFQVLGPMIMAAFANPVVLAVVGITVAIVALAAATGNMGNLISAIAAPFVAAFDSIKKPLHDLGKSFTNFLNQILAPFGVHFKNTFSALHGTVAALLTVVKYVFGLLGIFAITPLRILIRIFQTTFNEITGIIKGVVDIFKGIFDVIAGLATLNSSRIIKGFKEIGLGIVTGIWSVVKALPLMILNIIKDMVMAILHWLGIASPSKKFADIGKSLLDGLVNGIAGLPAAIFNIFTSGFGAVFSWLESLPAKLASLAGKAVDGLVGAFAGVGGKIIDAIASTAVHAFDFGSQLVKTIAKLIDRAIPDVIKLPDPLPNIDLPNNPLHDLGLYQRGGAIGSGYGGGDRRPALLEDGEHVFTKDEVRTAGGHGAIFALRRLLGGGGQGGPQKFAVGGAVGLQQYNIPGIPQGVVGTGQARSEDYQGVHGTLGGDLHNVQNFSARFRDAWKTMWDTVDKQTASAISNQENQFTKLQQNLNQTWSQILKTVSNSLSNLSDNMKTSLSSLDNAVFNALWYVNHATNASLKSFNAKPVDVTLGAPPKFAEGGMIGKMGERGKDLVHALLGRGEAVLNWGHQKIVDPALRAVYGFGLDEMFSRTRGEHAGGGNGYARGGYVSPFPKGTPITWERQDAGKDMVVPPGTPVLAIADGEIVGIDPNWYQGQPLIEQSISNGPEAGRYIYYAEGLTLRAGVGQKVRAGQVIGVTTSQPTGLEFGWGGGGTSTLRSQVAGSGDGAGPWSSTFEQFVMGLAAGNAIDVRGIPGGISGAAAMWKQVQEIAVKGSGAMAAIARRAIKKVTAAANAFGQAKSGVSGVAGAAGNAFVGTLTGPVPHQVFQFMLANAFNKMAIAGMLGNALQESDMDPNAAGGGLWQQISNFGAGSGGSLLHQMQVMLPQIISLRGAMNAAKTPGEAATIFEQQFERPNPALANMPRRIAGANQAFAQGFAKGGYANWQRPAGGIPIVAHAGEWLLNKMQQMKLASKMGMTVESLKEKLGFSGGPIHYAGGGETGETGKDNEKSKRDKDTADSLKKLVDLLNGILSRSTRRGGRDTFTAPLVQGATDPGEYDKSLGLFATAQHDTMQEIDTVGRKLYLATRSGNNAKVKIYSKQMSDALSRFSKNLQQVIGDNGVFDLASQAVAFYAQQQSTMISLALSGVRMIGQRLRQGPIPTALAQAEADLNSTIREIPQLERLQKQEVDTLASVNHRIAELQRRRQLTAAQSSELQNLVGARGNLLKRIGDLDSTLAQSLQDKYSKQVAVFQAQTDQILRGTATLTGGQIGSVLQVFSGAGGIGASFSNLQGVLSKVGPAIATGIAQMAQAMAQTLGDPSRIATADQAILAAATATQNDLMKRYQDAARKAQSDPRWQKVADDLLSQLESATESVVQAQAQALTDAISAQDVRGQQQQGFVDLLNRLMVVRQGLGDPLGAAAGQIQISRGNAAGLQSQLSNYQGLYQQAQGQGNVQAMNDLQSKIEDLTARIAEANLQTQQLITAYHQVSVTMLQAVQSASSGFFGAANQIAQTLGAIAGNQNLPALIKYATEAGDALVQQAGSIVKTIQDTMNDPNSPFGAFQGQANNFLGQLTAAFQQGPQQFADSLAQLSPQLASFEALLPPDEQTLFQNLVQSMIDNTTAQVDNTQQLQQLNATTNQQQFTSSAWTMFRQAIFNGLGGLLPQYAAMIPTINAPGGPNNNPLGSGRPPVDSPDDPRLHHPNVSTSVPTNTTHVNITNPTEVADPVYLGNAIAWRLGNDPNSR